MVENKLISGDKRRLNVGKSIFSLFCPVKHKSSLTAEVDLESTFLTVLSLLCKDSKSGPCVTVTKMVVETDHGGTHL